MKQLLNITVKFYFIFLIIALGSCSTNHDSYFNKIAKNDIDLPKSKSGDWLFSHKEIGQSLMQFKKSNPLKPTETANLIYLKPIGNFTELQLKEIETTRQYLEIFFQLKTVTLNKVNNEVVPAGFRRIGPQQHEQLLATYLRDTVIAKEKPKNAIAIMGITEMDLYPNPKWNYVFGLASYQEGLAVSSIYRLQNKPLSEKNFKLSLIRLLKISSHEIGHIFGLKHCIYAQCVMNGTNSMLETDKSILRLCSNCQSKLNSSLKFSNEKRLKELICFFKSTGMKNDLMMLNSDLSVVK
jgi:archaemetzincin